MTPAERELAAALGQCRMLPGTPAKLFALHMAAIARQPEMFPPITPRQAHRLHLLVHRFRRQIPARLVAISAAYMRANPMWPEKTRKPKPPRAIVRASERKKAREAASEIATQLKLL